MTLSPTSRFPLVALAPGLVLGLVAAAAAAGCAVSGDEQAAPATSGARAGGPMRFEAQEIRRDFGVGYAVSIADMNGNGKPDIVAISGTQLVWFENPSWKEHVLLDGQTPKDNVAIAPYDIDGDGRMDIALGAAWNPRDTEGGGTLHWVRQPASGEAGTLHDIGSEPTLHRIRWGHVDGVNQKPALIVGPLHGRGSSPPEWMESGARLLAFRIPANPATDPWPVEVIDDIFHRFHNFELVRFFGSDQDDIITASLEGVHAYRRNADGSWKRTKVGEGAPGEIRLGQVDGRRMIATVEPWHGHSVVLFLEPAAGAPEGTLWERVVIEDQIVWGHALAWADFNGDGTQQLAVGWRDKPGGIAIYDIDRQGAVRNRTIVEAEHMATEDMTAADLDGDGRPEVIASGRRTANVVIYWNRTGGSE
jgi:hypothetical protein